MAMDIKDLRLFPSTGEELRGNCPFCNDKKGHLYVNKAKGVFYCHRCGASGKIDGPEFENMPRYSSAKHSENTVDALLLDKAYSALIDVLDLSAEHYRQLIHDRKLSTVQIYKNGYRTLPSASRIKIAGEISKKAKLNGVPGFYKFKGKKWCLAGPEGLLVPVRNFEGRIWGMQIRLDNAKYNTRYCWLSSADSPYAKRPEGTQASSLYHVAMAGGRLKRIWITEGPLKGDIASFIMQETFVCVPGVNSWKKSDMVKDLINHGVKEAIIAYDADAFSNVYVAKAADKLFKALKEAGIKAFFAVWPMSSGKGIDDMLQNGYRPHIMEYDQWKTL